MRWTYGAGVLALILLVAACGPEERANETGGPPAESAELAFAECMRDQGYDWPDPQFVDGVWDTHVEEEIDYESPEFQEAERVCAQVRQDAESDAGSDRGGGPAVEEQLEESLRFAACMRDQGIDFPDPVLDDDGALSGPAGPMEGIDAPTAVQEEFDEAWKACEAQHP